MDRWKIFISLDKIETVNKLCKICDKYDFDINVEYGRYVIDAKSILGVMSLLGNIVKIVPITSDDNEIDKLYIEMEDIGAYIV